MAHYFSAGITSHWFGLGNPRITHEASALVPCEAFAEILGHPILGGASRDYTLAFESNIAAAGVIETHTRRAIASERAELRRAVDIRVVPDTAPLLDRFGHTAAERRSAIKRACRRLRAFRAALRKHEAESFAARAWMCRAEALVLAVLDARARIAAE